MIIPAILPKSEADLRDKLALLDFAVHLQIDVVDGKFDDDISWPYEPAGEIADVKDLFLKHTVEVDLMTNEPIAAGIEWLRAGASSLIVHIESMGKPEEILELKKEFDFELGYAIGNDTELQSLYPLIENTNFVQMMGIKEIGAQGQPFDIRVLERVSTLRSLYPALDISIDGGVALDTIESLKRVGANRFVVGSAILNAEEPQVMFNQLLKISE